MKSDSDQQVDWDKYDSILSLRLGEELNFIHRLACCVCIADELQAGNGMADHG